MQALSKVIDEQKLAYQFPYSSFDIDTDIGLLVLSHRNSLPPVCVLFLYVLLLPGEILTFFWFGGK
jgi:hypothetical protein